jgi:hypothetical protein
MEGAYTEAHKVHAREMHAHEVNARKMHAHEMHAREVPTHETHAREMHARETHARKVHACVRGARLRGISRRGRTPGRYMSRRYTSVRSSLPVNVYEIYGGNFDFREVLEIFDFRFWHWPLRS